MKTGIFIFSQKNVMTLVAFFIISFLPGWCFAHFPWLNAENGSPNPGAGLSMTIGYGHNYPMGGFISKDKVENLLLTGPIEKVPELHFTSDLEIKSSENLTTPGVYIVSAGKTPGFYTKTAEGGKQQSKKGLTDVIKCSYSHSFMKTVINVGEGAGRVDTPVGQLMEIIPLKNPKDLHAGGALPILVLYKGKPWTGEVVATFAGFSTEKDTWAQKIKTNEEGKTDITLTNGGYWLLRAIQEEKYPDAAECDNESFSSTLTFAIK